ncbi:Uncharacterised protein [Vibrio cholerae]|uniref:Uncharacterized protein n=1 Tax=Vibrio cholerae TaxID=666 RepID=A0A655ZBI3_VIBCL|nr:Uncharacterised protein [Vibrio cholerae]CSB39863.1 Uncharacterised protein [Vibrio cholerae]CSC01440.1 Uncharacterised protein [Vibrio cholerae]CSC04912.1 Uncharacterised protein [Vibrio cholerae]CSC21985.1 Uncharacterised protein [Vibrio cholerae]
MPRLTSHTYYDFLLLLNDFGLSVHSANFLIFSGTGQVGLQFCSKITTKYNLTIFYYLK